MSSLQAVQSAIHTPKLSTTMELLCIEIEWDKDNHISMRKHLASNIHPRRIHGQQTHTGMPVVHPVSNSAGLV